MIDELERLLIDVHSDDVATFVCNLNCKW